MTVMMRWYLGECFSECLKHVGAIQAAVKVDVELSSEVGQMTQLCMCVCVRGCGYTQVMATQVQQKTPMQFLKT